MGFSTPSSSSRVFPHTLDLHPIPTADTDHLPQPSIWEFSGACAEGRGQDKFVQELSIPIRDLNSQRQSLREAGFKARLTPPDTELTHTTVGVGVICQGLK